MNLEWTFFCSVLNSKKNPTIKINLKIIPFHKTNLDHNFVI